MPLRRFCAFVTRWEWLLLLGLAPLFILIRPAWSPILLLLPLFWGCRRLGTGRFVPPTPLDGALLLLLLMVLVSLYATYDVAVSLSKIAGLLLGACLYFAVVAAAGSSRLRLNLVVAALLVAGLGVAVLSLPGARWPAKLPVLGSLVARLGGRPLGLPGLGETGLIGTNQVAGVLLWIVPLALALAGAGVARYRAWPGGRARPLLQLGLVALALSLSTVLLLTQSRSAYLGLAAGLGLLLVLAAGRYRRPMFAGLAVLGLAALSRVLATGPERLSGLLFLPPATGGGGAINTLNGRLEIWSRALYAIQDFPFTGLGLNTFRQLVHLLYPLFLIAPGEDIAHAHNHFLQTALDLGLPGLVAYLALWLGLAVMLWRSWRHSYDPWLRSLTAGASASLLGYFVYGLLDTVALGARPGFIFWLLLGLVGAVHEQTTTRAQV